MKKLAPKRKFKKRSSISLSAAKKSSRMVDPLIGLKKILVPIDFSDHSKKALRYALPFARQFNAQLELMYVVEPTIYPSDFGFGQVGFPDVEKELHEKATQELAALIESSVPLSIRSSSVVSTGIPFVEITTYAQAEDIDLIIVATHGRTGVEHILFGSTAEKIIRKAPCPVLVVRAEEHDFINERA
ncbi:MAG: universal stress protein [Bacteroidetes bacterium]|nr:universal stress protein [Bacteroidota bacterium]